MDSKKTLMALGVTVLSVAILSVSVISVIRYRNSQHMIATISSQDEAGGFDLSPAETEKPVYNAPPINVTAPDVIKEPTDVLDDNTPAPDVSVTTDADGNVTQSPDWAAQKELAPDTDLTDPDTIPQYVGEEREPLKPADREVTGNAGSTTGNATSSTDGAKPPASTEASSSPSSAGGGTPANGATQTIDGSTYTYLSGFGWVKNGNGGTTEYEHFELSGNKVGY